MKKVAGYLKLFRNTGIWKDSKHIPAKYLKIKEAKEVKIKEVKIKTNVKDKIRPSSIRQTELNVFLEQFNFYKGSIQWGMFISLF